MARSHALAAFSAALGPTDRNPARPRRGFRGARGSRRRFAPGLREHLLQHPYGLRTSDAVSPVDDEEGDAADRERPRLALVGADRVGVRVAAKDRRDL